MTNRRHRQVALLAAVALLIGLAAAVYRWAPARVASPDPTTDAGFPGHCPDCNVLLITLDSVRADFLPCYGSPSETAPRICERAEQGALFERAYSPASQTIPALQAMMTGAQVSNEDPGEILAFYERQQPLASLLAQRGYRTAGFSDHLALSQRYEDQNLVLRGFEEVTIVGEQQGPLVKRTLRPRSREVTDAAWAWIAARGGQRFFAWAHYYDPHWDHSPHVEVASRMGFSRERCGRVRNGMRFLDFRRDVQGPTPAEGDCLASLNMAEIWHADEQIGGLLDAVGAAGWAETTVVVITADHGEEFLDHGGLGHKRTVYDEVIRVPLIVLVPGLEAPVRISEPVSTAVLPRLVLAILDGTAVDLHGDVYSRTFGTGKPVAGAADASGELHAVIHGDHKYVSDSPDGSGPELFDLVKDPAEKTNLAGSEHAATLSQRLSRIRLGRSFAGGSRSADTVGGARDGEAAPREDGSPE